ncbi:MAG: TolC family protein [Acidobacteriota bacterium]
MPETIPESKRRAFARRIFGGLSLWSLFLALFSNPAAARPQGSLTLIEALELALENSPSIAIARHQSESDRGSLLISRGDFDGTLSASVNVVDQETPLTADTVRETKETSQGAAWTQTLRTGQTVTGSADLEQVDGDPTVSTGTVSFTVRQPLLRGRGRAVTTAQERAADEDFQVGRLELLHEISRRLAIVAQQYWSVRGAMLDLEILRYTEERSRQLLDTTRRLIEAQQVPAAEMLQLEADLASREASRVAGERVLFQARQDLAAEIGLGPEDAEALPLPGDPFPEISIDAIPESARALLAEASVHRADLAAEQRRLEASRLRLFAAEDDLKPRLDLVLTPSYTGLVEGGGVDDALRALGDNIPGLSTTFGVSYLFPIANQTAEGLQLRAEAALKIQADVVRSIEIQIGADVPSALDAVRQNARTTELFEKATKLFLQTLENEEKKLQVGSSILLDVISQRDRLTSAQQRLVASASALARAVVDLRFETGTLVRGADADSLQVRTEDFTTVPAGPFTP